MENLIGNKYGSLTVLEFSHASENKKAHFWKCKCDCGKEKIVKGSHLKGGNVKVCSKICPYRTVKPREKVEIISKNIFIIDQNKVTGITTKGVRFYFDKEDYEDVSKHTWGCDGKGYLITAINKKRVYLHHFILGIDDNTQIIDHKDNKPENCQRYNLRPCSHVENTRNCKRPKNNTSGFKGVSWRKDANGWKAFIKVNYKQIYLGLYKTKIEAARAYNEAALKYFGEFALLNDLKEVS